MLEELVSNFGLLGWLTASILANTILPIPLEPLLFLAEATGNNPVIWLAVASIGATVGESTVYAIGKGSQGIIALVYDAWNAVLFRLGASKERHPRIQKMLRGRMARKIKSWMEDWAFGAVIIGAFTPLPMVLFDLVAGYFKYDYRKFFAACAIGKMARYTVIFYGGSAVLKYFFIILR